MALGDYSKSIVGALITLGASLQVAQAGGVTSQEWVYCILGALIVGAAVWGVPNTGTYAWVDTQQKTASIIASIRDKNSQ